MSERDRELEHLAALERLNGIVAAFASMVSHETRSALVGIQGLSELIRDGDLDVDEVRGYADDVFREAEKINMLIGEMFDLSRLEMGQSPLRKTLVDMNRVTREVVEGSRDRAARHSIELDLQADPSVVMGDVDRLREAVHNITRFCTRTANSGTFITATTIHEGGRFNLKVHSSSLKLVDFDDWLYGRYERYERRPSAIIGAGLGLAIARTIVELHGGRVEASSAGREGSEFQLSLPTV